MRSLPEVLLVEDDASLQRFVEMALEGMPLRLHCCATVGAALQRLQAQPAALIITDLMLPDASGCELLRHLQAEPALRGDARIVVFSGGLDKAARREELSALGAWRLLAKPCSLDELELCVTEGLRGAAEPASAAAPDPVHRHFGGNEALYRAFRASCLQQFAQDCSAGDTACRSGDVQALRRLAHSLKSVLLTLGHEAESAQAQQLELLAETGDMAAVARNWPALRERLSQLH